MGEPFAVNAAKSSWVVAILAFSLYFVSANVGAQLDPETAALAGGIGSLLATFCLLGSFALGVIGLFGMRHHGTDGILIPAVIGLMLSGGPIAFVLFLMLSVYLDSGG